MNQLSLNLRTWDAAWHELAAELFREFLRADSKGKAVELWHRAQTLERAREMLSAHAAGDDAELVTALNPINPYKDIAA